MTRLDRHLFVVLGLVALTALLISLPRGEVRADIRPSVDTIPLEIGAWQGRTVSGDDAALPVDVRSLESIRRTYEIGERRVWLGVARYPDENGPDIRPSPDAIAPTRGVSAVARGTARIPLDAAHDVSAIRISTRYSNHSLTTFYWYRLGRRAISNEYGMRFWLGVNTLLRQRHPLFLVRVSTTDGQVPDDFVRLLVPHLDTLSALAERKDP